MKTRVLWALSVIGLLARADGPAPPVAEFSISDSLLRTFEITGTKTTPFNDRGKLVQPNLTLSARFRLGNADGQAVTVLDFGMHGTSVTQGTQAVGRRGRQTVTVAASTNVDLDYAQEIALSAEGMKGGSRSGSPHIQLTGISTSNSFQRPLINRIVTRATLKRAPGMIQSAIPGEEQRLQGQLSSQMDQGMATASKALDGVLADVQSQLTAPGAFPFDPSFSSRAGGSLTMRWSDPAASQRTRAPKPALDRASQSAASTVLHEDFLIDAIAPQIAGKELRLSELRNVLCVPQEKPVLDFCQQLPKDGPDFSILFDAKEPIGIHFDNGGIRLRLNAVYRTRAPSTQRLVSTSGGPLLRSPANDDDVTFETLPYSIDVSYKLEKDGARLEELAVRDREPSPVASTQKYGTHDGADKANAAPGKAFLSNVAKRTLQARMKTAFRERIDFPTVAFPTKIFAHGLGDASKPQLQVTEAGALLPMEIKADKGWLVVGRQFCREGIPPLGVQWTETVGGLALSSVVAGSPAEAAGLRPGDRIEGFGVPGERLKTPGTGDNDFLAFMATRTGATTSDGRTVELSGRSADGKLFRRTVTVCPKNGNFRPQAEALLARRR